MSTSLSRSDIQNIVLEVMDNTNQARPDDSQIEVSADAALFGDGSALNSMDLVSLIVDLEEALAETGCEVVLSDERAMSMEHSPFRTVNALVDFVCSQQAAG